MFPIPRLSAPLVKDIRTGEGVAEWVLGVAVAILTAVGDLGVVKGTTFITILVVVKAVRRGLIKSVAAANGHIGPPIIPGVLPSIDEVLKEIAAAEALAKEIEHDIGPAKPSPTTQTTASTGKVGKA